MNLKNIRKSIQWVIKKIKRIKIGFHFELKILKIKNQTFSPTFRIFGSKSNIYVSLAFKSDTQRRSPSEWDEEYLYLKGEGYDSKGKTVNFEEKVTGTGHRVGGEVVDNRWKFTIFKSGTARITDAGGELYGEDSNCETGQFEVTKPSDKMDGDWENAVTKVKFRLEDCDKTGSRRECDIEIADSNCFKNKNSSSSRDKLGKTTKDLYLKGQGHDSFGKLVNFDEKMPPENGEEVGDGQTKYVWQLAVYKSGTTRFMTTGGGNMGSSSGDVECDGKPFVVTKPNMGGTEDWEKAVTDIPYYLVETDIAIRQEIF